MPPLAFTQLPLLLLNGFQLLALHERKARHGRVETGSVRLAGGELGARFLEGFVLFAGRAVE